MLNPQGRTLGPLPRNDVGIEEVTVIFAHRTLAQRVALAPGEAAGRVRAELDLLAAPTVMVIAANRSRLLMDDLAARTRLQWNEIVQHVPVELAERARAAAARAEVDTIVAIGGGSAIGLAKAIALTRPAKIIAVPTTYAGSEATNVWGLTDAEGKRTGVDDRVLPIAVVYDPELVLSMPAELAVASGLNAVAHCVDALWAPRADPINARAGDRGPGRLAGRTARRRRSARRPRRARPDPVRLLSRRGRLRVGRVGDAPQDLPRPRRIVRPAARGDARRRPAVRAGLERPVRARGRPAHRVGLGRGGPARRLGTSTSAAWCAPRATRSRDAGARHCAGRDCRSRRDSRLEPASHRLRRP